MVENQLNDQRPRQRRPDRAVYVPRRRRSQTPPRAASSHSGSVPKTPLVFHKENANANANVMAVPNLMVSSIQSGEITEINSKMSEINLIETTTVGQPTTDSKQEAAQQQHLNCHTPVFSGGQGESSLSPKKVNLTDADHKNANGPKIETNLNLSDKDFNEEKEFERASKEMNRRNRRIIKQTFDCDVLEINEISSIATTSPPQPPSFLSQSSNQSTRSIVELNQTKRSKLPQMELHASMPTNAKPKRQQAVEPSQSSSSSSLSNEKNRAVHRETDDWESIFDDNGDCLKPKVMDEITASVCKVTIAKPKNDYKCDEGAVNLDDEEFPHVLEVSNFPVEFKTQDLHMVFSEYKDLGFDIKWVDDTHALVVFSSSKIAARVLNTGHAFVKLRPLTQATAESRARAKKSALFLQPYRQRPETCAALARRLVTGALGVRLSTAREEREIERRVLKEAKERKMMAAKQRDEAWES